MVQCRPKEANSFSQRSQYQVTESPNIIAMLQQQQQQLIEKVLNTQQAIQQKQKDFDRKLEVVDEEISKYMSLTDSRSDGEKKSKVTRELSVRFYMRSIWEHI